MNYALIKRNYKNKTDKLLAIYNTLDAVRFIKNKLESRKEELVSYVYEETDNPLFPESSYKVDEYLSTLISKQPK